MHFSPIIFALLAVGAVTCVIIFLRGQPRVQQRLQVRSKAPDGLVREEEGTQVLPPALVKKLENKLGLSKDSSKFKELKKTMVQAGFGSDRAVSIFMGLKLGFALALPVLALPFLQHRDWNKALFFGALYLLLVVGYFLPSLVLGRLVEARKTRIRDSLPDALDLMVVCVEAGQGLNAAMKRVAEDMRDSNPDIAHEILKVNLEINAGMEREQALRNLGERTGVEEVISLANILIQSERFGTSVGRALKVQSDTLRTTRRQKLEELAAKTPVKLVFPLLLFIFPSIMVVILGPAMIRISENLLK